MFSYKPSPVNPNSFQSIKRTLPIHVLGAIVAWIGILKYYNSFLTLENYPSGYYCLGIKQYLDSAFMFGVGLGIVGSLFQAVAMWRLFGGVRWMTVIRLCALWGLVIGLLCFGAARFGDVDSGAFGSCLKGTIYSTVGGVTSIIIVFVLPIPIILGLAWIRMHFIWKAEARWQFYRSHIEV